MLKTLTIEELKLGHYVTQVIEQRGDISIKSKGKVKSEQFLQELINKGVKRLEVDLSKSELVTDDIEISSEEIITDSKSVEPDGYSLEAANDLYHQAIKLQSEFIDDLQKGAVNDLSSVKTMSAQLVENLLDNPNALSCLTLLRGEDDYLLEHSLNCCILMAMFAEHLGYDTETIEALSLGALLMDVGMANVPNELRLAQEPLSEADWAVIKAHVEDGIEMIEQAEDLDTLTKTVIEQHHERTDGSGYPNALVDSDISVYGKMAAIVDTYDAMVSQRSHQKAVTPAIALKRLARAPGLDDDLVMQFIARIGIYPVGSVVKLKSGKLAIVAKSHPVDMLNPVVMTFYSVTGSHYNDVQRIDLSKIEDEIDASVQPADFSLNLTKFFKDVFIPKTK
ncbi:HD domain-containing protein [Alteromonas sp. 5E99-2]|uniref:HD-GYP domain-containing protein n=1 Tax=Alteromonas sp. 5E99-2 TaxID=2817683 RepID=UPI001A98CBCC|nr:HD domain-containing phosphohydrolase [Alteromonas sp. 5E99-2]MBO1254176.1 HD domain-containing protein [Alteromonas sp. 5E99-2]